MSEASSNPYPIDQNPGFPPPEQGTQVLYTEVRENPDLKDVSFHIVPAVVIGANLDEGTLTLGVQSTNYYSVSGVFYNEGAAPKCWMYRTDKYKNVIEGGDAGDTPHHLTYDHAAELGLIERPLTTAVNEG